MCPKLDTHYPYPKPDTSSVQMGTYPSTHTHPEFVSGVTRHPPTHDPKWSGRQPWLRASPHLLITAGMSTTKRKRGGTPARAGPAAAAAASALPAAASTSAVAVPPSRCAASVDWTQTAAGSFHARAPSAAASAFAGTGGNMGSPSPYNPAKQVTPSPRTRGEQSHQLPVRSDSEDDSSDSTSSEDDNFEADANTAGASANVRGKRNHANDDKISNNCDLSTHVMDRAVDLFSSSSSSSSSSEDDMLDSGDEDSITKEVMQILEEEVRRGQESEDEMGQNALESENEAEDANDDSIAGADAGAGRNSSPTFEVERILARRYNRQRKRVEYLLAWRSGADDPAEHSWEPHEHLDYRAKDHVQERWGGCPNIRASDGIETNDPVLDGPRVAQYRLWEKQQLSLHRRRCKPQLKKKNNNFAALQLPIEADNAIAPERPLVPIPRPLVAEIGSWYALAKISSCGVPMRSDICTRTGSQGTSVPLSTGQGLVGSSDNTNELAAVPVDSAIM